MDSTYDLDDALAGLLSDEEETTIKKKTRRKSMTKRLSNEKLKIQPSIDLEDEVPISKGTGDTFMTTDAKEGKTSHARKNSWDGGGTASESEISPRQNKSKKKSPRRKSSVEPTFIEDTKKEVEVTTSKRKAITSKKDDLFDDSGDLPGFSEDEGLPKETPVKRNKKVASSAKSKVEDDLFGDDDLPGFSDNEDKAVTKSATSSNSAVSVRNRPNQTKKKVEDDIFGDSEGLPGFSDDDSPPKKQAAAKKPALDDSIIPKEKASSALTNLLGNTASKVKKKNDNPTMLDQILSGKSPKLKQESPHASPSKKSSVQFGGYSPSASLNDNRPITAPNSRAVRFADELGLDLNDSLSRPSTAPNTNRYQDNTAAKAKPVKGDLDVSMNEGSKVNTRRNQSVKKERKNSSDWLGLGDDLTDDLAASNNSDILFSPKRNPPKAGRNDKEKNDIELSLPWESPKRNNKQEVKAKPTLADKDAEDDFLNLLQKKKTTNKAKVVVNSSSNNDMNSPQMNFTKPSRVITSIQDKPPTVTQQQQQQQQQNVETESLTNIRSKQGVVTDNKLMPSNTTVQQEQQRKASNGQQLQQEISEQNLLLNQNKQQQQLANHNRELQKPANQTQSTAVNQIILNDQNVLQEQQQNIAPQLQPNQQIPMYQSQGEQPFTQALQPQPSQHQQQVHLNQQQQQQFNLQQQQIGQQQQFSSSPIQQQMNPPRYHSSPQFSATHGIHAAQQSNELDMLQENIKKSIETKYQEEFNSSRRQFERDKSFMESELRDLHQKVLQLEESKSHSSTDHMSIIRELENKVRKLELENKELLLSKDSVSKRHQDEIVALEISHKTRLGYVEDSFNRREKQLLDEHETAKLLYDDKLRHGVEERYELEKGFKRKAEIQQVNHQKEIERLKDLHKKSIEDLLREHEDQLHHLRVIKDQEVNAAVEAFSHTKSLKSLIQEVHNSTREVSTLQNKIDASHHTKLEEREYSLKSREQYIQNLEHRLQQQENNNDEERQRLQTLISKMEVQLREQTKQIEQDRWKLSQQENKLKTWQSSFEEERKLSTEQFYNERQQLSVSRDEILNEQRVIMKECYEEKKRIAIEKSELMMLQKEILETTKNDRSSALKAETDLESVISRYEKESSTVGVRLARLKSEEEKLAEAKREYVKQQQLLDEEFDRLNTAGERIQKKSEEIEEYAVEAKTLYDKGMQALEDADISKSECIDSLRQQESKTLQLNQMEQRLKDDMEELNKEKQVVEEEKERIKICQNCSSRSLNATPFGFNERQWNMQPSAIQNDLSMFRPPPPPLGVSTPMHQGSSEHMHQYSNYMQHSFANLNGNPLEVNRFTDYAQTPLSNAPLNVTVDTFPNQFQTRFKPDYLELKTNSKIKDDLPPPDLLMDNFEFKREIRKWTSAKEKDDDFFEEETKFLKSLQEKRSR